MTSKRQQRQQRHTQSDLALPKCALSTRNLLGAHPYIPLEHVQTSFTRYTEVGVVLGAIIWAFLTFLRAHCWLETHTKWPCIAKMCTKHTKLAGRSPLHTPGTRTNIIYTSEIIRGGVRWDYKTCLHTCNNMKSSNTKWPYVIKTCTKHTKHVSHDWIRAPDLDRLYAHKNWNIRKA